MTQMNDAKKKAEEEKVEKEAEDEKAKAEAEKAEVVPKTLKRVKCEVEKAYDVCLVVGKEFSLATNIV